MNLKILFAAAGLLAAAPSVAQVTATASGANALAVGANPYPTAYSGVNYYATFDTATATGFSPSLLFASGTSSPGGYYSNPFGDATTYAYVTPYTQTSSSGNSPVVYNTTGTNFNRVSFYWGSMDDFNVLSFLGAGGSVIQSFTGTTFNTTSTDEGEISRYVTFTLDPSIVGTVTGIRFASNGLAAFEFDNFAIGTAVPEAATWAMMMVGLGVVGGAMRRRSTKATVRFANA